MEGTSDDGAFSGSNSGGAGSDCVRVHLRPTAMEVRGRPPPAVMCGNTIAAGSSSGSGSDQMFWDELAGVDFDDLLGGLDEDWGEEEKGKEKEKGKEAEKGKEKKEAN
ncbi:uncharacterized protein A4U43_C05F22280 [Asparagus officinalis]|uniref:Uncharacterized protein n=1 Tax=Asparagus officinalis TaxID=4686 RepID=A0A5P1EUY9_ASPOF|nr:uncharacterized protein A4U43_C05F22280 [Asparagus officinalis]